jgi:ADP-heptose:LPS heptosyltransferase
MARTSQFQRHLDRVLGIPLVFLTGLLGRRRPLPERPSRIGIIQPAAIGDMILISGLLLHLRRCYPEAEIHVFHGPFNGAAVPLLPVDVVVHPCVFTRPLTTLRQLRNAKLDILIDSMPWARLIALLTAFSGARAKVGFHSAGQHIQRAFDIVVPYLDSRHEVENHRAVAELFGPLVKYSLQLRTTEWQPTMELPYNRLVLMHMMPGGSRAKQKSWPAENWVELARRLVDKGWIVGFTGGQLDREAVATVMNLAMLPKDCCMSLVGLSLAEVRDILAHARLLITVDTGIAHLAAALNAPVLGLHGPTKFERWGSWSAHATGLNSPHPAAGYINYGFEQHPAGDEVMASLRVSVVAAAVEAILKQPVS